MAGRPNIVFIMSDDHATHAMSCYGSRINKTPHLDRIADDGMRLDNCFCTNSICTPSRATILAGTYNHVNKVYTLATPMDNTLPTYPKLLQQAGYQTGIFGKWHLGTGPGNCPAGFDDWAVLPGQGLYHNPNFIFKDDAVPGGRREIVRGYVTDIIGDMTVDFIRNRDPEKPFCVMCHHKAPHRPWEPDEKHADMYLNEDIPEPETLYDTYENRTAAASEAKMRIGVDMGFQDIKAGINYDLPEMELRKWAYQYYIKGYLRVIASVDDNVGKVLDELDAQGIADDTIVIYTSDQGFYLGDHGWFDKRFMYEESLRMPFVMRYPREVRPGTTSDAMVLNVDFGPTFLDFAGAPIPDDMQGHSMRSVLRGRTPRDWRTSMYYHYYEYPAVHMVRRHYGVRTQRYKLIHYYNLKEWELFDLEKDPHELRSVYDDPAYSEVVTRLKQEIERLRQELAVPEDTGS